MVQLGLGRPRSAPSSETPRGRRAVAIASRIATALTVGNVLPGCSVVEARRSSSRPSFDCCVPRMGCIRKYQKPKQYVLQYDFDQCDIWGRHLKEHNWEASDAARAGRQSR